MPQTEPPRSPVTDWLAPRCPPSSIQFLVRPGPWPPTGCRARAAYMTLPLTLWDLGHECHVAECVTMCALTDAAHMWCAAVCLCVSLCVCVRGRTRRWLSDAFIARATGANWGLVTTKVIQGAGIAQWLEHRTRDWKVAGSNPCWNGGRIFFSRVDFLCWLLFRYPFHHRVSTVARKKSRSFCPGKSAGGRLQLNRWHAYTLRMWILLNRASALVTTCP